MEILFTSIFYKRCLALFFDVLIVVISEIRMGMLSAAWHSVVPPSCSAPCCEFLPTKGSLCRDTFTFTMYITFKTMGML